MLSCIAQIVSPPNPVSHCRIRHLPTLSNYLLRVHTHLTSARDRCTFAMQVLISTQAEPRLRRQRTATARVHGTGLASQSSSACCCFPCKECL